MYKKISQIVANIIRDGAIALSEEEKPSIRKAALRNLIKNATRIKDQQKIFTK